MLKSAPLAYDLPDELLWSESASGEAALVRLQLLDARGYAYLHDLHRKQAVAQRELRIFFQDK